jgi:DNA adenine methylase
VRLRPFLKWVGGKRQLLPVLRRFYPEPMGRYFEPFVGSGAVFFDLVSSGRLNGDGAVLSDDNADLIACYRRVCRSLVDVAAALERLAADHAARGRECYMEVRDRQFNPMRAAWRERGADLDDYPAELAAMLIYLNRTGYNGLFRVNSRGAFNVPVGRYASVTICDAPNLRRLAAALRRPGLTLEVRPFEDALGEARPGDFVYLDPPYAPVSRTAQFRSYTAAGFGASEQERLQRLVVELARADVSVLLSNSVAPEIRLLYEDNVDAVAAGLRACTVPARRAINSRASLRGAVREYLITNIV